MASANLLSPGTIVLVQITLLDVGLNFYHWYFQICPGCDFIISEIRNPHCKNLDLWVKIQFVQKKISQRITDIQRPVFRFGHVTTFFHHAFIA